MTKTDAIAAIVKLNPTANPTFLAGFSNDDLLEYLRRLSDGPPGPRFLDPDYSLLDVGRGPAFPEMDCLS
jgi:hypothetical protein